MRNTALTLKTILLGTIISLNVTLYGNTPTIFVTPELPALPQDRAAENNNNEDETGIESGGIIAVNEILCGSGIPEIISNINEPSGEIEGFLVFQWERRSLWGDWVVILGANDLNYEPWLLTETTVYRRR